MCANTSSTKLLCHYIILHFVCRLWHVHSLIPSLFFIQSRTTIAVIVSYNIGKCSHSLWSLQQVEKSLSFSFSFGFFPLKEKKNEENISDWEKLVIFFEIFYASLVEFIFIVKMCSKRWSTSQRKGSKWWIIQTWHIRTDNWIEYSIHANRASERESIGGI